MKYLKISYKLLAYFTSFTVVFPEILKKTLKMSNWSFSENLFRPTTLNLKKKQQPTATSFFLPHQNLAKSHHLSSGAKDSKPLKYINTDIREQNIYNYD